jgi:ABC-type transporter Mla subunit MlaD
MRSVKHVSIKELKKQPRLGMAKTNLEKTLEALNRVTKSGAFNEISNQLDKFKNTLPEIADSVTSITNLLGNQISVFDQLSAGVGRAAAYFDDFSKAAQKNANNLDYLIGTQQDLQQEFKMSSAGAFDFSKRLRSINVEIGDAKLFKYAAGLGKITGGFINSTKGNTELIGSLIKSQTFLQNNLGLSEEGAQKFELFSRSMGKNAAASIKNISDVAQTFSNATGQDKTQLMAQMVEDISSMGADVATQFGRVPGQLEAATMKARLLGTTMGELSAVGDKLLNIESSIGTEMEYQQLTGHRLLTNSGKSLTNEYRMAQLKGDGVKQAELMQQFLEKEGGTLETNYIARQKASELFGIDGAKLLEMNAQLKLQKELGVQNLVAQAEGDLKKLEASLRSDSKLSADQIDKVLKGAAAAADVRTPAERSADSLANMEKGIILKGQEAAMAQKIGTGRKDKDTGDEIFRAATSQDFVDSIDRAIKSGPEAFAQVFAKTFESEDFIKGVGGLGILSDRLNLAVTPLNTLGDSIPVLGSEIKKFTAEVTRITGFVKDAKDGTSLPNPAGGGKLPGRATGGYISGPGSGTSDSIPARLSDGEYVINAAATRRNKSLLDKINSGGPVGYAAGGAVTSTARMESLLSSILVAMRGSNVMGATSMNGRKRI